MNEQAGKITMRFNTHNIQINIFINPVWVFDKTPASFSFSYYLHAHDKWLSVLCIMNFLLNFEDKGNI